MNRIEEIGNFSNLILRHLDVARSVLVAFEVNLAIHPPEVQQTKWKTTTRQRLEKRTFSMPMPANHPMRLDRFFVFPGDNFVVSCKNTVTQLLLGCRRSLLRYFATIHLKYDYDIDRFGVQWIDCAKPNGRRGVFPCAYLGRNLIYRISVWDRDLFVHNITTGKASLHSIEEPVREEFGDLLRVWDWDLDQNRVRLFGDSEVFGFIFKKGIRLWVFNPNFVPAPFQAEHLQ